MTLGTGQRESSGSVLLVANYAPEVGYAWWLMESYWATLAEHFAAQGRRCFLAYPSEGRIPDCISSAPIETVVLPWPEGRGGAVKDLLRFVRDRHVTGVYLTDRPLRHQLYLELRSAGVKRIVVHDHTPGHRPPIRGVKGAAKAILNRLPGMTCDRAVGTTEFVRQRLIRNARFPAARCFVVPNGIPDAEAAPAEGVQSLREQLGIHPDEGVVALISRAHRYKNWSLALSVAQRLSAEARSTVHWVFCGDGPHLEDFRREATEAGVAGHCHFLGRVDDIKAVTALADVGFHPSSGEVGYSLAILEFMRAACPVVVSDDPSVSGATEHGRTGLVFPAGSVEQAASAISAILGDSALRERLGEAARERYLAAFTHDRSLATLKKHVGDFL